MPLELIRPAWGAPAGVGAAMSTRRGGVGVPPFDTLNLRPAFFGGADADDPAAVAENQRRFAEAIGAVPAWLEQVHGAEVVRVDAAAAGVPPPRADASVCAEPGIACTVLVADCLPVLLCSADGRAVGAAHAGWRGLAAGVVEATVAALCELAACPAAQLRAWLGPCIGPRAFEVGRDVVDAFAADGDCFVPRPRPDGSARWLADLPALARRRLVRAGVTAVSGADACTVEDRDRFYSYRRDGRTGRMAAAVWIARPGAR